MILIKNQEEVIREAKYQLHTTMDDYQTKIISIFDKQDIPMSKRIDLMILLSDIKEQAVLIGKQAAIKGKSEYEGQNQLITEVVDEVPFQYSEKTVTDLENNIQIIKKKIEDMAREYELDSELVNLKALLLNLKVTSYINGHYEMYVKDNTLSSKRS
jgi:succinylglutamate desuccinylase